MANDKDYYRFGNDLIPLIAPCSRDPTSEREIRYNTIIKRTTIIIMKIVWLNGKIVVNVNR